MKDDNPRIQSLRLPQARHRVERYAQYYPHPILLPALGIAPRQGSMGMESGKACIQRIETTERKA